MPFPLSRTRASMTPQTSKALIPEDDRAPLPVTPYLEKKKEKVSKSEKRKSQCPVNASSLGRKDPVCLN